MIPRLTGALSVPHGFFTRAGGVSEGPYESLNCNLSGGDDPARVMENRAIVARALGADPAALCGLTQVHGAEVAVAGEAWPAGAGPRADAMVSDRPGVALGIVTADCAPVLLADAAAGVIGAAHAGWRGATSGVLEATVSAMRRLGAREIVAVVGPCIGQAQYEVGEDVRDAVDARFLLPGRPGRWQFDLAGYCVARLEGAATALGVDTRDDARFWSHRRRTLAGGGAIGHQMSAIALPSEPTVKALQFSRP